MPAASAPAQGDALAAVRSFDPAQLDDSIHRLNEAEVTSSSVADLSPYLRDPDVNRRWAALYLAAPVVEGQHLAMLRPSLEDESLPLRVMAAGALIRLGVRESIPVLIEAIESEAEAPFADPPRSLPDLARPALKTYTGQSFDTPTRWKSWWKANETKLRWNGRGWVAN